MNQVCESRRNSAHVLCEKQRIRWPIMADEGGSNAQIRPLRFDANYATSNHSSVVCRRQEDHRANSAMAIRQRRGPRMQALKVLGTEGGMPGSCWKTWLIQVEVGC